jgi:predicted dehydrogenase
MNRKVKIGMISFAHPHAVTYLQKLAMMPDVEVAGLADGRFERVKPQLEGRNLRYYTDYYDLLATDIDAVIVCSENVHHARITIDAALAGKHVLCEKPLGVTREQMDAMIDACRNRGVQLMTAFPNRYVPAVQEAGRAIERGDIGKVLMIKGTNKGAMPGSWFIEKSLSGGGAMLDHSVHVMDIMRWILKSEVREVYAEYGTLFHELDIDDAGMVHVKFDNGTLAVLDTSWSRAKAFPYSRDLSLEIVGTEGTIVVDDTSQVNEIYSNVSKYPRWSYWGEDRNYLMLRDFIEAVRDGKPVPITGEDGRRAATTALMAFESARTGYPVYSNTYGKGEATP